jgi:hypothetical protein
MLKIVLFGAFYPNYYVGEYADKREFHNLDNNSWHREHVDPFRSIILSGLTSDATEDKIRV